ncbi:stalk domain-containing protein [Neobacillus sp. 3P2-tot-E-2]|uniref:stalk domain-containing protein n=1 Tax=Neobacillus sp. 3P2-tot-E-2 TaxID=3132212 RepID=UPI0039A0E699
MRKQRASIEERKADLERLRDYLPLMPVPEGLVEKNGMLNGNKHTWYEYVPKSYTGQKPVPLLVYLHGGGRNGLDASRKSTWPLVAEQEGFIVIYPNANNPSNKRPGGFSWNAFNHIGPDKGDDVAYLKWIIEKVCEGYQIDQSRIYMTGVSNGEMMTTHFASVHTDMLAGICGIVGPTDPNVMIDQDGNPIRASIPLPVYRWHGENDPLSPFPPYSHEDLDELANEYWLAVNQCSNLPQVHIQGINNTLVYTEGEAEFRFTILEGRTHLQDLNVAMTVWKDFFSRFRRGENGEILTIKNRQYDLKADSDAVIVADGGSQGFANGFKIRLDDHDEMVVAIDKSIDGMQPDILVPLTFISKAFGAIVEWETGGEDRVEIRKYVQTAVLQADIPIMITNGFHSIQLDVKPEMINGQLMVPILAIAEHMLNKKVTYKNGVAYISDHSAKIAYSMATNLQSLLK